MATPERTARTKQDPLLQFPQRRWVLSGVRMNKDEEETLIHFSLKIDDGRQVLQHEEQRGFTKN